jgi:hypothetical protein
VLVGWVVVGLCGCCVVIVDALTFLIVELLFFFLFLKAFGKAIETIMGQVKRLNGHLPVVVSREWKCHDMPDEYDPAKYKVGCSWDCVLSCGRQGLHCCLADL